MICPNCEHNNLDGSEACSNCLHDLTLLDQPVAWDRVQSSLMNDLVSALRPAPAVALPPSATVAEAIRALLEHDIGALPVVEDGRLVGIFSERDLITRVPLAGRDDSARPLRELMTRRPETVREADTLALALNKMGSGGYRHLPVVRVVGMISVRDLLRHITSLCRGGR